MLIVAIRGGTTLDVPTQIAPGLLITVIIANIRVGKKVGAIGVVIVRIGRRRTAIVVGSAQSHVPCRKDKECQETAEIVVVHDAHRTAVVARSRRDVGVLCRNRWKRSSSLCKAMPRDNRTLAS